MTQSGRALSEWRVSRHGTKFGLMSGHRPEVADRIGWALPSACSASGLDGWYRRWTNPRHGLDNRRH